MLAYISITSFFTCWHAFIKLWAVYMFQPSDHKTCSEDMTDLKEGCKTVLSSKSPASLRNSTSASLIHSQLPHSMQGEWEASSSYQTSSIYSGPPTSGSSLRLCPLALLSLKTFFKSLPLRTSLEWLSKKGDVKSWLTATYRMVRNKCTLSNKHSSPSHFLKPNCW